MRERWLVGLSMWALTAVLGCAPESEDVPAEQSSDLREGQVAGFDRNRVIGDVAFTDAEALDAQQIQAFLENTPYGTRSVLASYTVHGMTAAQAIAKAAKDHGINPIVILTRAQMEQSLVYRTTTSRAKIDAAFGCGCPDGGSCDSAHEGFDKQVECMASWTRGYLDDLATNGETVAGWAVGRAKKTLEGKVVTPANFATAALYTYTPWVGDSSMGNLAHYIIWKKFAEHVGYLPTGPSGCTALGFPSGLVAQTYPSPALAEGYYAHFGLTPQNGPDCFLDPQHLEDPLTGVVASSSAKVSSNFRVSEFFVGEPTSRAGLLEPALVTRLQALRTKLGTAVSIEDGFRSPERHVAWCNSCTDCMTRCDEMAPMAFGMGAIVYAAVSEQQLLSAAASSGFSTCRIVDGRLYVDVASPGHGCQ